MYCISAFFGFLSQAVRWTSKQKQNRLQYVDPKRLREGKQLPVPNESHANKCCIATHLHVFLFTISNRGWFSERKDLKVATCWNVPNLIPPRNLFHIWKDQRFDHTIIAIIQRSSRITDLIRAQIISSESSLWFQVFFLCQILFWNKCSWNLTCSSRVAL